MIYSKIKNKASMGVFAREGLAFFPDAKNACLLNFYLKTYFKSLLDF